MRRALPTVVLCLLPSFASAEVRPVRLEVLRGPEAAACPDEAELRSAVAGRLGLDPFDGSAPPKLVVSLSSRPPGFVAEVALSDDVGGKRARTLTGSRADCADLREAIALSVAVALEAFFRAPPTPKRDEGPPLTPVGRLEPVPAPSPASSPAPPVVAPVRAPSPVGSVRAALVVGAAPAPAAAIAVGLGLTRDWWSVSVEGRAQVPSGASFETGRIDVAALTAELLPCGSARAFRLCGIVGGGATWSWATQLSGARTSVRPFVALGVRAELGVSLGASVFLAVFAEGRVAPIQTVLKVGEATAWQTPPVAGALGVSATLRFDETDSRRPDK